MINCNSCRFVFPVNISNKRKIKDLKQENNDLKKQVSIVRVSVQQQKKNIMEKVKMESFHNFGETLHSYQNKFSLEVKHLKDQFTTIRLEAIKKDKQLVKFMQIAYDQEMYLNEIRRIVLSKNYKKAEDILKTITSVKLGSIIGIKNENEFKISDKLDHLKFELMGTTNIAKMHDTSKVSKRIKHHMAMDNQLDLTYMLDSQYMSKQFKNTHEEKYQSSKKEIDKTLYLRNEIEIHQNDYKTLRNLYQDAIEKIISREEEIIHLKQTIQDIHNDKDKQYQSLNKKLADKDKQIYGKVNKVKLKYQGCINDLKLELDIAHKLNERSDECLQKVK